MQVLKTYYDEISYIYFLKQKQSTHNSVRQRGVDSFTGSI